MRNFQRAIHLRFHFAVNTNTSDEPYDPKMYVRSNWTPPHWTKPPIVLDKRLENFSSKLDKLFKIRTGKPNLLPYQTRTSQKLQQHQDFLICPCNKNLGPATIERDNYIKIAMRDHLLDGRTYRPLSTADCVNHKQRLENEIKAWTKNTRKTSQKWSAPSLNKALKTTKRRSLVFISRLTPTN